MQIQFFYLFRVTKLVRYLCGQYLYGKIMALQRFLITLIYFFKILGVSRSQRLIIHKTVIGK
jgi:hypothetical protein